MQWSVTYAELYLFVPLLFICKYVCIYNPQTVLYLLFNKFQRHDHGQKQVLQYIIFQQEISIESECFSLQIGSTNLKYRHCDEETLFRITAGSPL